MPDQKCRWKSKYDPDYECLEVPLSDGFCILHSTDEAKNLEEFKKEIEKRVTTGDERINLKGCYFPKGFDTRYFRIFDKPVDFSEATFSRRANFGGATFSRANFSGATFSQKAYFIGATFSQEADFSGATFSQRADFSGATFSEVGFFLWASFKKGVDFGGARFEKAANFDTTCFKGETNFKWTEFWGWTFFFRNTKQNSVNLNNLPENLTFPDNLKEKIEYDSSRKCLIFKEVMSKKEKEELLELSEDDSYRKAVEELFGECQELTLGNPTTFRYTRFIGEEVRFQDVDLSHCSFLHSNIDKVDFRYCKFGQKDEKLLHFIPHHRQNVLKDEVDVDEEIKKNPTDKKPEEKYEPVRRLYLELKKNFEDKKDWDKAGDFHYGEMECRRKMKVWWKRDFNTHLVALYYWLSGYGERPVRSLFILLALVFLIFPLAYMFFEHDPFTVSLWDSVRVATFMRIGIPIEPDTGWGKFFLASEYILCPLQFALLALALRRKVKR